MTTREEIIAAIGQVRERLDGLEARIVANLDRPLLSGSWTVHDALCHLAADSNAVPAFVQRIQRAVQGEPRRAPGFDVDAYNERQIALRKQRPIEEVLRELRDGLSADVDRVEQLDEAFLLQTLPDFRGQVLPVSDQMRAYIGGHPSRHLDDIETAIGMAASPRGQ